VLRASYNWIKTWYHINYELLLIQPRRHRLTQLVASGTCPYRATRCIWYWSQPLNDSDNLCTLPELSCGNIEPGEKKPPAERCDSYHPELYHFAPRTWGPIQCTTSRSVLPGRYVRVDSLPCIHRGCRRVFTDPFFLISKQQSLFNIPMEVF
jgi:hypothetical protein